MMATKSGKCLDVHGIAEVLETLEQVPGERASLAALEVASGDRCRVCRS
jgi:hypothetical protein